ncbi:MAG: hypothetical protein H0V53_12785 [Rubrobacter sp.]|nr:hypothetical protein [Rubrobacter sp.]
MIQISRYAGNVRGRGVELGMLERLSNKIESGAIWFIQNPFLLLGLMVVFVLIKVFVAPGSRDSER